MTQEELEQLQSKGLDQFKTGKSLFGKDCVGKRGIVLGKKSSNIYLIL